MFSGSPFREMQPSGAKCNHMASNHTAQWQREGKETAWPWSLGRPGLHLLDSPGLREAEGQGLSHLLFSRSLHCELAGNVFLEQAPCPCFLRQIKAISNCWDRQYMKVYFPAGIRNENAHATVIIYFSWVSN